MLSGDILPLLLSLFGLVAVGQLLRLTGAVPASAAQTLGAVILKVTMPALIVTILADARFEVALVPAVLATTVAQFVALGLGVLLLRARGASRAAQGAAGMVASFSNTGFLGVPFVLAAYPSSPGAATAAVIIDTIDTTILLLTFGVAFASAMGGARLPVTAPLVPRVLRASASLLRQPMILAVIVGLTLALGELSLPAALARPLAQVGQTTPTLAFLTIGVGLELRSVRGQSLPLAGIAAIKLVIAPVVAGLVVYALGVRGELAHTAVLQAAMPTAVISAIIATSAGCDAQLAAAASVVTALLSLVTLPLILAALQLIGL